MVECLTLSPPGDEILLARPLPDDESASPTVVSGLLAAVETLWPVVQPLQLTLWAGCRSRELALLEPDVSLPHPYWSLRVATPPAGVVLQQLADAYRTREVDDLTLDAIRDWLATAFAQSAPRPDLEPALVWLRCVAARARLADGFAEAADGSLSLRDGPTVIAVPVDHRPDGAWVAGPVHDERMLPPLAFELADGDGELEARVAVGWSCWSRPGSGELQMVVDAINRLLRQGWRVRHAPAAVVGQLEASAGA